MFDHVCIANALDVYVRLGEIEVSNFLRYVGCTNLLLTISNPIQSLYMNAAPAIKEL